MKTLTFVSICTVLLFTSYEHYKNNDSDGSSTLHEEIKLDTYIHFSIWWTFVNKVFDGDLKVSTLKAKVDVGLGSIDLLDGEIVIFDGVPYRITEDGVVSFGADNDKIGYANAAFIEKDGSISIDQTVDFEKFREAINASLPSYNFFYVFKIHSTFKTLKLGGLNQQEQLFVDGLDILMPIQPIFEGNNIVGYHFILPYNKDYENVSPDEEFQFHKKQIHYHA